MKRFIFDVEIQGTVRYGIYAESEEKAREKLIDGNYDEDDLLSSDLSEDSENAILLRVTKGE